MDTRLINKKIIKEFFARIFIQIYLVFIFLIQVVITDIIRLEVTIGFIVVGIILLLYNKIYHLHLVTISEGFLSCSKKNKFSNWGKTSKLINKINEAIHRSDVIYKNESNVSIKIIDNAIENIDAPVREIVNLSTLVNENRDSLTLIEKKGYEVKETLEQLIETSKLASGVVNFHLEDIDINFLIKQKILDYTDEMKNKNLELVSDVEEEEFRCKLDGEKTSKALDIILLNVINFSQQNTRVYLDIDNSQDNIKITIKNISQEKLNISYDRLKSKKSKLNLEIAKGIVEGQNGRFSINIDGDLFKVTIIFYKDGVKWE